MATKQTRKPSKRKAKETKIPKDKLLSKLTIFFFDRPWLTGIIWIVLVVFGAMSYTTLLKREGFPSVNIPVSIVSGTYFVNDPAKVDSEISKPISEIALKQDEVKLVQSQSSSNFFIVNIQFKDGIDAQKATNELKAEVVKQAKIPQAAQVQYIVPFFNQTGDFTRPIDIAISFYDENNVATTEQSVAKAQEAVEYLNTQQVPGAKNFFVSNPFKNVTDPTSGKAVAVQQNFDRFGVRQDSTNKIYSSVIIGVTAEKGTDIIKLDSRVHDAIAKLEQQSQFKDYNAEVSATAATTIKDSINELQRVLLEGLIAVLVVGSIVIAIRASLITVASMITVLLASIGFLYLIGYSLNVITLFALILGLALIVDDTIIMVEAIDASRRRNSDRRKTVQEAIRRISRAMVAATITASLSFAPLLFVGGILGVFIRAIPVTIIASLLISLLVALIIIPFMARFILLGKKQMGKHGVKEPAAGVEARVAKFISSPMLWARNSKKRLFGVGITALVVGFGFIFAGMFISTKVVFNIFPPTKDTNGLTLTMNFPPGTNIQQAQKISADADKITSKVVGENFVLSSLFNSGTAETANESIELISYSKRDVSSQDLKKQLQAKFDTEFKGAKVVVGQSDVGPPSSSFIAQIDAADRAKAFKAAQAMASYMNTAELKRVSGTTAHFTNITVSSSSQYDREDGKPIVTISSGFDSDDTTTLVVLAQDAIKKEFSAEKLNQYGLKSDAITFNLGQEEDNQDSFKTLVVAFPILLFVMYVLLFFEFRSLLQPLLIFMAIPFSIFGVMLGLYLTHNAISFFAMLGFFALLGLSIKNTILLTDYANQARQSGMGAIDAAHAALEERFRPLFATSVTAVVSLIPLALTSPFWQGLAVVLIFGLLSSTFLVLTVFPYYYLGAEYLRLHISARDFFIWLVATVAVTIIGVKLFGSAAMIIPVMSLILVILQNIIRRRLPARAHK